MPSNIDVLSKPRNLLLSPWAPTLALLFGYATLNRGFAYIGAYPIFIGEIILVYSLAIINHRVMLPKISHTLLGKLLFALVIYNGLIFVYSFFSDAQESLRNSVYWVYAVYGYIGYCLGHFITVTKTEKKFFRFLLFTAVVITVYYSLFPLKDVLKEKTNFLPGADASLVGYYSSLQAIGLGFATLFLFTKKSWLQLGFPLLIFFIVFVSQARAAMVGFAAILFYITLFDGKLVFNLKTIFALFISISLGFFLAAYTSTSTELRGEISADFLWELARSIFFESGNESLDGTRGDRIEWWRDVYNRTMSTNSTMWFGLGFDTILVDRATGENTIIRYPHNSFVSVFGFGGFVGMVTFLPVYFLTFIRTINMRFRVSEDKFIRWYPLFFIGFTISAFFSTVLEAPFHSAIFWTITGLTASRLDTANKLNSRNAHSKIARPFR